jgi:hypothetical protein
VQHEIKKRQNKIIVMENIQLTIDIKDIINVFGSARELSGDYKKYFDCDLSVTTIAQWVRRKNIRGEHLFCLAYIAKQKNLRFELSDFISKGSENEHKSKESTIKNH